MLGASRLSGLIIPFQILDWRSAKRSSTVDATELGEVTQYPVHRCTTPTPVINTLKSNGVVMANIVPNGTR
jgi:hypothetical protein